MDGVERCHEGWVFGRAVGEDEEQDDEWVCGGA